MKPLLFANLLIEREAGGAPTAFRIWKAGRNDSDDGPIFFTEESAQALLAEQDARDRLYAFDFDHLSLLPDRPAASGRAAGWHKLEVRDGELWAVDVEWCADAKAGLEEDPPHWRYFSPAFRVDKQRQVVSYTNCALCINPKTHGLPALAAERLNNQEQSPMDEILETLKSLGATPEQIEAVQKAIQALASSSAPASKEESAETSDENEEKKEEGVKAAEGDDDTKDDEGKLAHSATALLVKEVRLLAKKVDRLESDKQTKAYDDLLSSHTDLDREFVATLRKLPLDVAKIMLAHTKAPQAEKPSRPTHGEGLGRPELLQGEDKEAFDAAFGTSSKEVRHAHRREDGTFVMHNMTPTQYRAHLAAQKGSDK